MEVEITLSFVLVICTAAYTVINFYQLRESKATRKQKTTPLMIAYIKCSENHQSLVLSIKNIGEGLAKNVKINLVHDINRFGKEDIPLSQAGIFKNGFNIFPSQLELCFTILFFSELETSVENEIELEITYESINKDEIKDRYVLPYNQITGQGYSKPPDNYLGQIPYYLNEIKKILDAKKIKD